MMVDDDRLTQGFIAYMRSWRPIAEAQPFNYGIRGTAQSADAAEISLAFIFLAGHHYCCPFSGCHHGLMFDEDFERLRACLRSAGVEVARPMRVRLRVICQVSARFLTVRESGELSPPYEAVRERRETIEYYEESTASRSPARAEPGATADGRGDFGSS